MPAGLVRQLPSPELDLLMHFLAARGSFLLPVLTCCGKIESSINDVCIGAPWGVTVHPAPEEPPARNVNARCRQQTTRSFRYDLGSWLEEDVRGWFRLNSLDSADTKSAPLSALESAVAIFKDLISFRICTYEKKWGRGHATQQNTLTGTLFFIENGRTCSEALFTN